KQDKALRGGILIAFAGGAIGARQTQHPAARLGSRDEISLTVEGQHAYVCFLAGLEKLALAVWGHLDNLSLVPSRDVQRAVRSKFEVPDVFGFGIEEDGLFPGRGNAVDLAIGRGADIERAFAVKGDGLRGKLARLKDGRGFSAGVELENLGRRAPGC